MIKKKAKSENRKTKILAVLVFWFLFFVIEVFKKGLIGDTFNPLFYSYYLPGISIWILLTFPTYFLFRKFENTNTLLRVIVFVFLGILVGTMKTVLSWGITHIIQFHDATFSTLFAKIRIFYFIEAWIISWVMLILFFIKELYDRYTNEKVKSANLENQLTKAELHSLKMRLQPHFLFNAHNNIAMLVRDHKNDEAVEMISGLSDLLRLSLEHDGKQQMTVMDEIKFTKQYLDVESLRFEDTLRVEYDIGNSTKKILVPNMILQPVVENAIKHGISKHLGDSSIKISTSVETDYLVLRVKNTGPYLERNFAVMKNQSHGLGITIERLNNYFGANYSMELFNWSDGVVCELKIPKGE